MIKIGQLDVKKYLKKQFLKDKNREFTSKDLSKKLKISRKSVQSSIRILKRHGEIDVRMGKLDGVDKIGRKKGGSCYYIKYKK